MITMTENITPSTLKLWDTDEAIKHITHDGLLDTIEVMNEPDWPIRSTLTHSVFTKFGATYRAKGLIEIAIQLGKIKSHDTPVNWIAWAERKGYNTDHLECFKDIQKHEPVTDTLKKINEDTGDNKEKREHELRSLIKKVFTSLNSPKNNIDVWNALKNDAETEDQNKKYDKEEIIQEMDRETIRWFSWRGAEQDMSRRTFDNYLSKLRNP